jgi:hypothetical protein
MEEAVGLTLGVLQLGGGEACMVGACRVRSCVTSGSRRLRAYSSETMKPVVLKKIKIELETIPQGSPTTVMPTLYYTQVTHIIIRAQADSISSGTRSSQETLAIFTFLPCRRDTQGML